ncbi:MAG: MoaD/ThiS family protein [Actinomycetota bacterium]
MNVQVRLGAGLARLAGTSQLTVDLHDGATIGDLLVNLEQSYPNLASGLDRALPVVSGSHVPHSQPLERGQDIALLFPAAGG